MACSPCQAPRTRQRSQKPPAAACASACSGASSSASTAAPLHAASTCASAAAQAAAYAAWRVGWGSEFVMGLSFLGERKPLLDVAGAQRAAARGRGEIEPQAG